jgi:hypothetical protein
MTLASRFSSGKVQMHIFNIFAPKYRINPMITGVYPDELGTFTTAELIGDIVVYYGFHRTFTKADVLAEFHLKEDWFDRFCKGHLFLPKDGPDLEIIADILMYPKGFKWLEEKDKDRYKFPWNK